MKNNEHYSERKRENRRRFAAKQQAQGLCLDCASKPREGSSRCQSCLDKRNESRAQKKKVAAENGMCAYCGLAAKMPWHRMCENCYCRDVSWGRFRTTKHWQALQEKFQAQEGRCAISGVLMTLGRDCELDHILPTSRGGANTLENTQWVLMVCNRMKDNLLEDEFWGLIEQIYHTMKGRRESPP